MEMSFGAPSKLIVVRGAAYHVPPHKKKVTSKELEERLGLPEGHIFRRTGILTRYVAGAETTEDLAVAVGKKVLKNTGLTPDAIFASTFTPSTFLPGIASVIAYRLGVQNCSWTSDTNTACTGGTSALILAANHLASSDAQCALVVASDTATKSVNWGDSGGVTPLLGDAAAAVVLAKGGEGIPIRLFASMTSPQHHGLITLNCNQGRGEPEYIKMKGGPVFQFAADEVPLFVQRMLRRARMDIKDVDLFVMHHANGRLIKEVKRRLGNPPVFSCIEEFGNTSSAATLLPFAVAQERRLIKPDMKVMLVSFGAGMTVGGVILGS